MIDPNAVRYIINLDNMVDVSKDFNNGNMLIERLGHMVFLA